MSGRRPRFWGDRSAWVQALAFLGVGLTLGATLWMRGREPAEVVLAAGFSAIFFALAWIDLRWMVIPNRIVYPALALALGASPAWPSRGPVEALAGGLGALTVALAIRAVSRGGLGGGDVKMAALAGAVVGSPGVLQAGLVSSIAGGFAAVAVVKSGRDSWGDRLPYGPYLALGAIAVLLG